jgi:hypothetical protein
VDTIEEVVAGHHAPDVAVADGQFVREQMQFAQRAHVHVGTGEVSPPLAIVGHQQAGTSAHAHFLYALNVGCADPACEQRVFAEVLKVPSRQRRAHEIQHGREQNMPVHGQHFAGEDAAEIAGGRLVPSAGQRECARQQRGACALLLPNGAQPLPAVEHFQRANAQSLHTSRSECAVAKRRFLLQSKAGQQIAHAVLQRSAHVSE